MYQYTTKDIIRFWAKVNKDGSIPAHMPHLGQCWEWTAALASGYGHFYAGGSANPKQFQSHHVSWELSFGDIPNKQWVLHKCDNPKCVNPEHLFLGNQKDNMYDMNMKGRRTAPDVKGEKNPRSKLTWEQVWEIRKRYALGETNQSALGKEYGVDHSQIKRIVTFQSWK